MFIELIKCWDNQLSTEVPNGSLCNVTNGLYCDWLCSDYSIRVVCCDGNDEMDQTPAPLEEELHRNIRLDETPIDESGKYSSMEKSYKL